MQSQKNVGGEKFGMAHQNPCLFAAFAFVLVLLFSGAPGAWAYDEIYTSSGNFSYQGHFNNNGSEHNTLGYMDAAYFGGYHSFFFTLLSTHSDSYTSKLYWRTLPCATSTTDEPCYGSVDIGNTTQLNFRFKTVVFNDVLYLFYTPSAPVNGYTQNRIYYRTVVLNYGADGKGRMLEFGDEKYFQGADTTSPHMISFATLMNGRMYIVFTSGTDWYYSSSQDGLTFSPATFMFHSQWAYGVPVGPSGTVFHVPDQTEGWKERMMIAYSPAFGKFEYFFFDGETAYGWHTMDALSGASTLSGSSVRLWTGTVQGYPSGKYAIQAFMGSPEPGTDPKYASIYHREYTPSGPNGDEGAWSPTWSLLDKSSDDKMKCRLENNSDTAWTIAPQFSDPYGTGNTKMILHLYYSKGADYTWKIGGGYDTMWFRDSWFYSDIMEHDPNQDRTAAAGSQDLSSSMVVGVIEGTPPFPINGGVPVALNSNTSIVDITHQSTHASTTTWSAGGSVALSFGVKTPDVGGFLGKLSAGLKYTQEAGHSESINTEWTLYSFTDNSTTPKAKPGDLGWLLVLKPEILSSQYIVKGYDGTSLAYCNNTSCTDKTTEEMRLILLTWGPGSLTELLPYYLETPARAIGDDEINGSRALLTGMNVRPLSTDLGAWWSMNHTDPSYSLSTDLPTIAATLNVQLKEAFTKAVNNANTRSANATFTLSAEKLGLINFSQEASITFSMDVKTTTAMSCSLGFWLNLPACKAGTSCISELDIGSSIYVPNEDASGYGAPWISDDIRYYKKPRPWCLSYKILNPIKPLTGSNASSIPSRLTVRQLQGDLFFDRKHRNHDRVSVKLELGGLAPGFSLDEQPLSVRFGNYTVNSGRNYVVSRRLNGKNLFLELKETEESKSSIRVKLSYDSRKSILDIDLDAEHIDLIHLFRSYGLGADEDVCGGVASTVPLRFFLGERYVADGDLNANCSINDQNIVCRLDTKKDKRAGSRSKYPEVERGNYQSGCRKGVAAFNAGQKRPKANRDQYGGGSWKKDAELRKD